MLDLHLELLDLFILLFLIVRAGVGVVDVIWT